MGAYPRRARPEAGQGPSRASVREKTITSLAWLAQDPNDLVVSRSEAHRQKMEQLTLAESAVPLQVCARCTRRLSMTPIACLLFPKDKHQDSYWQMSLRGGFQRYVQVGNAFSGLFCPIAVAKESTSAPPLPPSPPLAPASSRPTFA